MAVSGCVAVYQVDFAGGIQSLFYRRDRHDYDLPRLHGNHHIQDYHVAAEEMVHAAYPTQASEIVDDTGLAEISFNQELAGHVTGQASHSRLVVSVGSLAHLQHYFARCCPGELEPAIPAQPPTDRAEFLELP